MKRVRRLASVPARDAATRHLLAHPDGSPLYPGGSLASPAALERRARKLDAWPGEDGRAAPAPAEWLAEQNAFAPLHPAQAANLDAAARPGALFVLTGQQPGLLGGPALVFHKAATAARLARACAERLQRPVVPVFWAAGDDSDLSESNAAEFLEPDAGAGAVSLGFPDAAAAVPMSLRKPSEEALRALFDALPAGWSTEARALARECYIPGRSLTASFLLLAQRLLGSQGVLFVDGFAAGRLPAAQAILRRVARDAAGFDAALERGTRRLRETLNQSPQVPARPGTIPAFLFENGVRARLFSSDSGRIYTAGAEGHDLGPKLEEKTLLHSALSRPLVAGELFPVLGHVLGPAELRYFAQIADVFPAFGAALPPLAPRAQGTVVSAAGLREAARLGFTAGELQDLRPSHVRGRLTEEAWRRHAASREFPEADYRRFREALIGYQARLLPGAGFESPLRRFDRAFGHYREQARRRVYDRTAAADFQALRPLLRWLGNGTQDRHLNLLSLLDATGERGLAELAASPPDAGETGVVHVTEDWQGGPQ